MDFTAIIKGTVTEERRAYYGMAKTRRYPVIENFKDIAGRIFVVLDASEGITISIPVDLVEVYAEPINQKKVE